MIPTEVVHEALIPIGRYSSTNSRADLPQTASESAFTRTLAECDDGEVEDACGVCDGTDSLGLGCDATGTIFTANLPVGSPWPMLGRNVFRASYTPIRTNTSTRGDLKWSYTTSDAVIGSPSISSDGTIYAGDTGGGLYGIDTQTGRTRYQTTLASGTSATPVIDESGNVYIGTNDGSFYSLTANLTVRWQFPTSDAISSNALVYNNAVFFGSQNRLMYAVEKDTGELIWSVRVVAQILTNPVLSTDGQVIILLVSNDDVYTISVADGSRNR
jgi:outer membrane protein assembly factor BamB